MLPGLHSILKTAWNTSRGTAARRVLWSIWSHTVNGVSPTVNLWSALTSLDYGARTELARLITVEADTRTAWIRELLETTGEWDRIDTHPISWE